MASKRKCAPRSSTSAVTNTRRPHRRGQQKKQRLAAALRRVLAVVHHRDTNVTHADVTRRRGWPFIVVGGLGIGSVARQAAQLSASGWRGRGVPTVTARHCQRATRPDPGRGRRLHAGGSGTRKFDLPMGPLKKKPAGERLRRAGPPAAPAAGFLGYISGVSGPSSSPENLRLGTINLAGF